MKNILLVGHVFGRNNQQELAGQCRADLQSYCAIGSNPERLKFFFFFSNKTQQFYSGKKTAIKLFTVYR